jgi:heptosyltransferase II
VLCTPALKAIRDGFTSARISYYGSEVVQEILGSSPFNDTRLGHQHKSLSLVKALRQQRFSYVILFKNSFHSALICCLAGIPVRAGYAREGRTCLLTHRLRPARLPNGAFKPMSMVDYYLALARHLGCTSSSRIPLLFVAPEDQDAIDARFPEFSQTNKPTVVLIPGGAFGPSKLWPASYYAKTADYLIEKYQAQVVISVSPNPAEKQIATQITQESQHALVNLGKTPVSLGELKALIGRANLVISNDTGPRHIAIALGRKVITLFGPNDPAWTDTGYKNEQQVVAKGPCTCCQKPHCKNPDEFCMDTIAVDTVCHAADKMLC